MDKITVLFPGGFKPLTGAHMELAQRYAELPEVEQVILLIGEKERDGITRNNSMQIFDILNDDPKIKMQPTAFNSPIMAAYEFLFALPEDTIGSYAMAASTKGDDYVRTKDFVPNVEKYKLVGDKNGRKIPTGVNGEELSVNIDPLVSSTGEPISATTLRNAISTENFNLFITGYPNTDPDKVKQIWTILTGLNESKFTIDWWKRVFEGSMGEKNKDRHDSKIKKLRHFLDNNKGTDFVYDFDQFGKTVFGAPILEESVLKENYITRKELAQIEPVIDGFFRKYGIDVDFQGKTTHFIDRLNDPRNEGTIRLEDLEKLFEDLAERYGEQIVAQIQKNQPTAIESDLQFDVPIHMPFMLTMNRQTGKIKLIPRTIKAQRRKWQSNDPKDVIYRIESTTIQKPGNLLTEGGAAGHMQHPWDSHDLTFVDMKEIVRRALDGRLDIEEAVTEKTDGQNIQVTWKNGQIGFARNKGTVVNPMTTAELQAKFDNRGPISEAFGEAGNDLQQAFAKIPQDQLNQVFKNGRVFANMEIIYPATRNVIAYEVAVLQFHNLVEYDETGNIIETDAAGGALIQRIVKDANADMQNTFQIIPPQQIKMGRVDNFEDQEAALINEIDQLRNTYNLQDNNLVTDYHKAWWSNIIRTKSQELGYELPDQVLNVLVYRWAFFNKETSLTVLKKMITSPEFLTWVLEMDKGEFKRLYKENMEPFESIFLRLGVIVLQNAQNFLAVNPNKAVQQIKTELAELIRELQQTNDIKTLDKLKLELQRIQKLGGFDAIVPSEGIVFVYRGQTFKLTGAFAPVNQILGVLKYSR
jgi:nicotinamide mononucleotide adenylyltransferase